MLWGEALTSSAGPAAEWEEWHEAQASVVAEYPPWGLSEAAWPLAAVASVVAAARETTRL